jgi:hypothetical protein
MCGMNQQFSTLSIFLAATSLLAGCGTVNGNITTEAEDKA